MRVLRNKDTPAAVSSQARAVPSSLPSLARIYDRSRMHTLRMFQTDFSTAHAPQLPFCCHRRFSTNPKSFLVQKLGRDRAKTCRWQADLCHGRQGLHLRRTVRSNCSQSGSSSGSEDILQEQDTNRLTTALNVAIAAEDYRLAATIRDRLTELTGNDSEASADWTKLGIPEWLAERAERIGYRFPTGVRLPPVKACSPASTGVT